MPSFPNYKPDSNSQYKYTPRVLRADFGDGYSARTGDGLNPYSEDWQLTFTARPKADIAAIKAFLLTVATGTPFDWTAPDDVTSKKWRLVGEFTISDAEADTRSIKFSVERYFGA